MRNTEKLSVILLMVFGLLFANFNQAEASTRFPDTKSSRDEILYLADKEIINGYPDGTFGPNKLIKRVHAVQMILRELGVKTGDAPNPNFNDITPSSYGYAEIAKAKQLNIISGKDGNRFDPNGNLTRGEMAKILVEAYKLKGSIGQEFKDIGLEHFSRPYVSTLAAHNITSGYPDGTFRTTAKLTREHFALFMARLLNDQFKKYNATDVFENISDYTQSVVLINLYDENGDIISQGSGFITSNNLIATIFENVSGGVKAEAVLESGETVLLEGVVAYDEYADVAILKPVKKINLPSLPLGKFSSIKVSDPIAAIGILDAMDWAYSLGEVEDVILFEDPEFGDIKMIESTGNYDDEFLGAPLLNNKGYVIGLHSFMDEDLYYATSADFIEELLAPLSNKKFSNISVQSFEEMPTYEYDFEEEYDLEEE